MVCDAERGQQLNSHMICKYLTKGIFGKHKVFKGLLAKFSLYYF